MILLPRLSGKLPGILCLVAMLFSTSGTSVLGQTVAGCPLFPADNVWNTPVDNLPLDPRSSSFVTTIGSNTGVHPDFGSGIWDGGPIGIPYKIVPGAQPKVAISFDYAGESDPGPYPIPADAAIEGGSQSTGDRHVLVVDQDNCLLYETWSTYPQPDGTWHAGSGAIFDLRSNALRPSGWTSSDAAGLPILPGLVRYEEVASGEIRHALRFTAPQTRREFIWPARHYASSLTGLQYPPMGQRFRLKSGFDISGFSPEVQVILTALKKYGMILADNGSSWYISGSPDPGWNDDVLVTELRQVIGSDFEAVDESALMIDPDSGQAVQGSVNDTTPPDGSISINGGAEATRSTSVTLTLSATDVSGVSQMCISNTTSCTSWVAYGMTKSWTLTPGNGIKTVYAWFKDKMGNAGTTPYSASIIVDTTAPANGAVTATPGNGRVTLSWSGFADTISGVAGYKCVFSTSITPSTCSAGTSIYAGSGTSYIHTGLTNGRQYYYRVCVIDGAGNISTGATAKAMPVPETDPPTGSISINGGKPATRSTLVTLTLSASDVSGVAQMCISNTTSCTSWVAYVATKSWTLTPGNGIKTVYAWFKDKFGNADKSPYSASIGYDTVAPTNGTVTATPGDGQTALAWTGFADALSGITGYKVVYAIGAPPASCSAGTAVPGYDGISSACIHAGLTNGMTYGYRVCAVDKAGNMSSGATATARPTTSSSLWRPIP